VKIEQAQIKAGIMKKLIKTIRFLFILIEIADFLEEGNGKGRRG